MNIEIIMGPDMVRSSFGMGMVHILFSWAG